LQLVDQMQRANTIFNDQALQIRDAALLLLISLIFSAFFQFTDGASHNFLPKEEKERTEKLEKEEIREKLSAAFSKKNSNGGDTDNELDSETYIPSHHRLFYFLTSVRNLKLHLIICKKKLFLLFKQLVLYDSLS